MEQKFDKKWYAKLQLQCADHQNYQIEMGCADKNLKDQTFFCQKCKIKQLPLIKEKILSPEETLYKLSQEIEQYSLKNRKLYEEILGGKKFELLNNCYQNPIEHLKKVTDHVNAQKIQISEDIDNLSTALSDMCINIKNQMNEKLDIFFKEYEYLFKELQYTIESSFAISTKYQYLRNYNNFSSRIQSQTHIEIPLLLNNIKESLIKAGQIELNKNQFSKNLKQMASDVNKMMQNLPLYQNNIQLKNFQNEINNKIQQTFLPQLKIFDVQKSNQQNLSIVQQIESFFSQPQSVVTKMQSFRMSALTKLPSEQKIFIEQEKDDEDNLLVPQKIRNQVSGDSLTAILNFEKPIELNLLKIKCLEQYAVDFQCSNFVPISEYVIAQGDRNIRIYDLNQKKILHQNILFSSVIEIFKVEFQNEIFLISAHQDNSVLVWKLSQSLQPIKICEFKEFQCNVTFITNFKDFPLLIIGDQKGQIFIIDYTQQQVLFFFQGRHFAPILSISFIYHSQVIVASEDGIISVWKYSIQNQILDSFEYEKSKKEDLGDVSCIIQPLQQYSILCQLIIHLKFNNNLQFYYITKHYSKSHKDLFNLSENFLIFENFSYDFPILFFFKKQYFIHHICCYIIVIPNIFISCFDSINKLQFIFE